MHKEMMIVAHRGASGYAPENTLSAFRLAWAQGADAIEGDFRLTADGCIVCIHNRDTMEVAGKHLVIQDSSLGALRELDVGVKYGMEYKGSVIPTLTEVLLTVPPHKKLYIEIKCGIDIVPKLLREVSESHLLEEQIVFISFDQSVIYELKTKAPHYKAFWLCCFKEQVPGEISPTVEVVCETLVQIHADGLSSNAVIPALVVKEVQKRGFEWHVWTVDDLETARRMKAMGARSLTTNVPDLLKNLLKNGD